MVVRWDARRFVDIRAKGHRNPKLDVVTQTTSVRYNAAVRKHFVIPPELKTSLVLKEEVVISY